MVSIPEMLFVVGALGLLLAVAVPGAQRKAAIASVTSVLMITSFVFGGLAWAGVPALYEIPGVSPPVAKELYDVRFLSTSDTDRTEAEVISADGRSITFSMSDANMDGLGDVNLDLRVTNLNTDGADEIWPFNIFITFVSTTEAASGGLDQPIVNMTDMNTRWDVTFTLTETGSPTLVQIGDTAQSKDWKTGLSDTLNADFAVSPTALDDVAAAGQVQLRFSVGGVEVTCFLVESA